MSNVKSGDLEGDIGKRQVSNWIKSSGLLSLTVSGIVLYVVFSISATIFYDRLGVTPSDVGVTYSNVLSGSTLAAFAFIFVLAVLLSYLAVLGSYSVTVTRLVYMWIVVARHRRI